MIVRERTASALALLRGAPAVDLAVGVLLTAFGLALAAVIDTDGGVLKVLAMPLVTVPVIWRRREPLNASVVVAAGVALSALPTLEQVRCGVAIPAMLLVLYALGRRADRRAALGGLFVTLGAFGVLSVTDPNLDAGALVLFVPLHVGVWASGRLVASRAQTAAALQARSGELEQQRAQTAQLAVEVERTRLTSELDGAVRERIGEIVELAERGERETAADPDAAKRSFGRIESAGRASLDEMRGLLGALRSDKHAARVPRPTLAELDALLAAARAGGHVVDLEVAGERRPLPDGVEIAAYRIVEHALAATDADRDRRSSIRLRYDADALEIEVDVGYEQAATVEDRPIAAARQQAAARGGSFAIRAAGLGRATLCARLPLAGEHA